MSRILRWGLQSAWVLLVVLLAAAPAEPSSRWGHHTTSTNRKMHSYENMQPREILGAEPMDTCGRRPGFERFLAEGHRLDDQGYMHDDWPDKFDDLMQHPDAKDWPNEDVKPVQTGARKNHACKPGGGNQKGCHHRRARPRRTQGRRAPKKSSHVTYGQRAGWGEFPSYARLDLYFTTSIVGIFDSSQCGATIIGPRTLLTSSYCWNALDIPDASQMVAVVGLNSPNKTDRAVYELEAACRAHDYCEDRPLTEVGNFMFHDFMILTTKVPINYTDYIQPACISLGSSIEFWPNERTVYLGVGLGEIEETGSANPAELRFSAFSLPCRDWETNPSIRRDRTHQCIRGIFGTNICKGDIGGPLYYEPNQYGERASRRQFLGGIISNSTGKCNIRRDLYKEPSYFLDYVDVRTISVEIRDTMNLCQQPEKVKRICGETKNS